MHTKGERSSCGKSKLLHEEEAGKPGTKERQPLCNLTRNINVRHNVRSKHRANSLEAETGGARVSLDGAVGPTAAKETSTVAAGNLGNQMEGPNLPPGKLRWRQQSEAEPTGCSNGGPQKKRTREGRRCTTNRGMEDGVGGRKAQAEGTETRRATGRRRDKVL